MIKQTDFFLLKTDWCKQWGIEAYYYRYPILSKDAADWLINFNLEGFGIDTISVDSVDSTDFMNHRKFLKNNIILIENLKNLNGVRHKYFEFYVLPLNIKGADGSPVRAIARLTDE